MQARIWLDVAVTERQLKDDAKCMKLVAEGDCVFYVQQPFQIQLMISIWCTLKPMTDER